MNIGEWGNATWYMFHTLAFKLKDENSTEIRELLKHISNVCYNLPCPDCRQHAKNTLSRSNLKLIKTKQDLINFLLQFHNLVNRRLKKPVLTLDEHNKLYIRARTSNIVSHFMHVMSKNSNNSRSMLDSLHRQRVIKQFISYLNSKHYIFNP